MREIDGFMKMTDLKYMERALLLAQKGEGHVAPNPMVGCVIVKAGRVIAEGWHKVYGGDHAEVIALKKAGSAAKGATMYVTLEPCAHWGRTPPCVDAVIAAGLRRVVLAMTDPNPKTNGQSVKKLRAAGVEVVSAIGEAAARRLNRRFIKYITSGMPYVVVKTAQTLDGRIATRTGDSRWVTADTTRDFAKQARDTFDAILVGINTVLADDPLLNAPSKSLVKIVMDSQARLSSKARLFLGSRGKVIVAVTTKAPAARIAALRAKDVDVMVLPSKEGRVNIKSLFKGLAKQRISSILIEGGASVIGSALKAGLVDEMHVYVAPKLIGDKAAQSSVDGLGITRMRGAMSWHIEEIRSLDPDLLIKLTCSGGS